MTKQQPPKDMLDWLGITETPNWRVARLFGAVITVVLTLLLLLAVGASFGLMLSSFTDGANLGTGTLIVAILGAPFLVWNTMIRQKTVTFQKEGHITDRISKAVEQLGAEKTVKRIDAQGTAIETTEPNLEVRIGGLLSLERIAQDSTAYDKGRDHVRVMEIICAYVRENSKAQKPVDIIGDSNADDKEERARRPAFKDEDEDDTLFANLDLEIDAFFRLKLYCTPPRIDIQIALGILGRRTPDQAEIERKWGHNSTAAVVNTQASGDSCYRLDLRGVNLQRAELIGMNFSLARLDGARMEGANLKDGIFSGAILEDAKLIGASANSTDFLCANLEGSDLRLASLRGAKMQRAILRGSKLDGAKIRDSFLDGADLTYIDWGDECIINKTPLDGVALRNTERVFPKNSLQFLPRIFADGSVAIPPGVRRPAHWPNWRLPHKGSNAFHKQWHLWLSDPENYTPPPKPSDDTAPNATDQPD